jgi:predicted  nucleic acid-binding Zn-ribbon protein
VSENSSPPTSATVHVESIGGIDETTVELTPGVTALVGPNATNRTSLLQAVSGAIGSDRVTLKGDSSEGRTELVFGEERFTRRLERTNGDVDVDGEPYLDDPELADLYALLLEDNEIRRAVRDGDDLRDLVLRPVDTDAIQDRIETLVERRQEVDAELNRLDALADDLSELVAQRSTLRAELDEIEDRLGEKRARLERVESESESEGRRRTATERRLEDTLASLRDARSDLEEIESELTIERKSRRSLREERERLEEQYGTLSAPDEERLASLDARIDTLRERKRSLESAINELQQVVRFNDERLDDPGASPLDASDESPVTDELLPAATTTCWTCGTEVEREQIEETVERLREIVQERTAERRRISTEITDLAEERDEIERRRDERERLSRRLDEIDAELQRQERTIETLETRRETVTDRVADLEREVERLKDAQQDELLDLQQQVSELGFERDRVADELADLDAEIESIEDELEGRDALRTRRESIAEELAELRTRIDRIEADAVDAFNSHMSAIVDALGYENVERIWLESTERPVSEGEREVLEQTFDLHVVRESDAGTVYEDTVEHLSASEREVVGLVVALAGYLVHDVEERVPFMLLDALEMIDGERLVELIEYLKTHVPYLVVVLLPDHVDAFARDDTPIDRRITDI